MAAALNAAESNALSERLHSWAMKEMCFQPHGKYKKSPQPTAKDFQEICCGELQEIWKFVISRVHSLQTVRKVRGNLILDNLQRSDSVHNLQRSDRVHRTSSQNSLPADSSDLVETPEDHLKSEITRTLSQIWLAETKLKQLQQDISNLEHSYRKALDNISDIRRRIGLLSVYKKQYEDEISRYEDYNRSMQTRIAAIKRFDNYQDTVTYFSSKTGMDLTTGNTVVLESACAKNVRESCEEIEDFLQKLLQGKFGMDENLLHLGKNNLWSSVTKVLESHPPKEIIASLESHALNAATNLKIKTDQIDSLKDAERLCFKLKPDGQVIDLCQAPSFPQSVQQQLEKGRLEHLRQFLETEKAKNASWRAECEVEKLKLILDEKLQQIYPQDSSLLDLAREVYAHEMSFISVRTSHEELKRMKAELEQNVQTAAIEKDQLLSKHQKIQDFKKLVESKQNLIQVLIKQNLNSKSKLKSRQTEILQHVQQFSQFSTKTFSFEDGILQEMKLFNSLHLPKLVYVDLESSHRMRVSDLSIYYFKMLHSDNPDLRNVFMAFGFPHYKAPECLLPSIIDVKKQISALKVLLFGRDAASKCIEKDFGDFRKGLDYFNDLVSKIKKQDKGQLQTILPNLQLRLVQATQGMADCLLLKDGLQDWWNQPAQFAVPWVTVDGCNMQQWKDQWVIAGTKLRRLQLENSSKGAGLN